MTMKKLSLMVGSLVLALCGGGSFAADPPADAKSAPATKAAPVKMEKEKKEAEREITYEDLDKYMGQRVIVHSKIGSTRSGKLIKHTMTEIIIAIDDGGYEFSFTREAIQSLAVPVSPPDAKTPDAGDGSAKKN
jgi:hypothetical protein